MTPDLPASVAPVPPPVTLPWLLRRGLGFAMLFASLSVPGCVALFT